MADRCTVAFATMLLIGDSWAGEPAAQALADGVVLIEGGFEAGRQPDGNTVVLEGDDGLVVFDTGRHPAHSQRILDFAATSKSAHRGAGEQPLASRPHQWKSAVARGVSDVDRVRQPCHRRSHVRLPCELPKAGAAVPRATGRSGRSRRTCAPTWPRSRAARPCTPDINITQAGELSLAGRALRIGYETNTVTGGDVWLYDTATDTLAAGDLVTLPAPFFDTACPPRWSEALARLQAVDLRAPGARPRPGDGPQDVRNV